MQIWSSARTLAEQTPAERNRYVDFLRALAILVVVIGHWLIATAWFVDGNLTTGHLLRSHPETQWLTWLFQVMPIFFMVGGYANAMSLASAKRGTFAYGTWLATRLNRLVAPLLLLIIAWALIGFMMHLAGASAEVLQFASRASLIPTWFLAIYIMVVILAPATYRFWNRFGFGSIAVFVAVAVLVDVAFFVADLRWLGWSNYFWVWLAVHQLGFAWRDGRTGSPAIMLFVSGFGFIVLWLLTIQGPYPLAMVGSPDKGLSNTSPPKITLVALASMQFGVLLALEQPMRRLLKCARLWTAVVLVNSMIMTIYLWHITLMIVVVGLLYLLGGPGLGFEPGSLSWWLSRPLWIVFLTSLLAPLSLLLSPLERRARRGGLAPPSPVRQIAGATLLCLGVSLLALHGFGRGPIPWSDLSALGLVMLGASISGLLPWWNRGRC